MGIEFSKIAAMAGQGGLFIISTPLKHGVLLESLDEKKVKVVAGASSKVSILSEISIYTTTAEGSVPLLDVFKKLHAHFGGQLPVSGKSDAADLRQTVLSVLPELDTERVYASDLKKLVTWYGILIAYDPEAFQEANATEASKAEEPATEKPKKKAKETSGEEKEAKPKKAKAEK